MEEPMQIVVEFNESAFKHHYTEADIHNAIDTWIYDDIWDTVTDKHLLTGFNTHGNPLELMYNKKNEQTINVFHAMRCRDVYLRLLRTCPSSPKTR